MDESDDAPQLTLVSTAHNTKGVIIFPPTGRLILRDETGQEWAVTVRTDGQLQTAKWPDGEAMTPSDYESKKIIGIFESMGK